MQDKHKLEVAVMLGLGYFPDSQAIKHLIRKIENKLKYCLLSLSKRDFSTYSRDTLCARISIG